MIADKAAMLALVAVAMTGGAALAEGEFGFEGRYSSEEGQSLTADLTPMSEQGRYAVSLSTTVAMVGDQPGCGGGIDGEIMVDGTEATLSVDNEGFDPQEAESPQNMRFCEVKMSFPQDYTLEIQEIGGCTYYHGASCSFSGTLMHDAAGL